MKVLFPKQAEFIIIKRHEKGLTQGEVAKQLLWSTQVVSNIERGLSYVPKSALFSLCQVLNIDFNEYLDKLFEDFRNDWIKNSIPNYRPRSAKNIL